MTEELTLKPNDKPYAVSSSTSVQRTWKRVCGWTPPSKDPVTLEKWEYYKSLALRSELALQIPKEAK